jgi:hypothetical protein
MVGKHDGYLCSNSRSPSPLGLQWRVFNVNATRATPWKFALDPAVTLGTPTWIIGPPGKDSLDIPTDDSTAWLQWRLLF